MRSILLAKDFLRRCSHLAPLAAVLLAGSESGAIAAAPSAHPPYLSGAASRCTGPAIRCPGFDVGIPQGDYNLSLRQQADIDLPNPYDRDETWLKMPAGKGKLGATSAIDIDVDGKSVWIARRCEDNGCYGSHVDPVMKFDEKGNFVRSFGADTLVYPHGMWVDREGNVWVADTQSSLDPRRGVAPPAGTVPAGGGAPRRGSMFDWVSATHTLPSRSTHMPCG